MLAVRPPVNAEALQGVKRGALYPRTAHAPVHLPCCWAVPEGAWVSNQLQVVQHMALAVKNTCRSMTVMSRADVHPAIRIMPVLAHYPLQPDLETYQISGDTAIRI